MTPTSCGRLHKRDPWCGARAMTWKGTLRAVAASVIALPLAVTGTLLASANPLPAAKGLPTVRPCHGTTTLTIASHVRWAFPGRSVVLSCPVKVAAGGRLTIERGTVVKLGQGGQGNAIYVAPRGSLDVAGTAARPVIFTSYRDNSAGGRTSTGAGAPTTNDYSSAIGIDGQTTVSVAHAVFRYGEASISAEGQGPQGGCSARGDVQLQVSGSLLEEPLDIGACDKGKGSNYEVDNDLFRMPAGSGTTALVFSEPTNVPFEQVLSGSPVANNTFAAYSDRFEYDYQGTWLVAVDVTRAAVEGLALAGPGRDTFSDARRGTPVSVWLPNDQVPEHTSFDVGPGVEVSGQVFVNGAAVLQAGAVVSPQAEAIVPTSSIVLGPRASLRVEGTAAHPVLFTGGSMVWTGGGTSLLVDDAVFSGASGPVIDEARCNEPGGARVTIEGSTLDGGVSLGGCDKTGGDRVTITGDTFRVPGGTSAMSIGVPGQSLVPDDQLVVRSNRFEPGPGTGGYPEIAITGWPVQDVALSGPDENHLTGSGVTADVGLSMADVPAGESWQVSPSSGAVLALSRGILGQPGLSVEGRLELDAGLTVDVSGEGVDLGNSGALDALGTKAHPVTVVTGLAPDWANGGWAVSLAEGSTVDVSHADFKGGWYAFTTGCYGLAPKPGGSFSLTNSSLDDEVSLGDCNGSQNGYKVTMSSNTFDVSVNSGQFAQGGGYDPSALQPAVFLYSIDPSGVALSGANENVFKGPAAGHVVLIGGASIPAGKVWKVSPSSGAVLEPSGCPDYSCSGITIEGKGTLDLAPGTVVKSAAPGVGVEVAEGGTLQASGTASEPVVFTSINDDQVAGDSNGDGSSSHPSPNAYGTGVQFDHAHDPSIRYAVFEYASTAVYLKWGAVTIDDSDFAHDGTAIDVEETTGPDYAYLGNLPCMPPWLAGVYTNGTWFAPNGQPSKDIALSALVGLAYPKVLPKIPGMGAWSNLVGLSAEPFLNFSGLAKMLDLEPVGGSEDLVPWTVWSCPVSADVTLRWPVTPVSVSQVPPAPHFAWVDSGGGVEKRPEGSAGKPSARVSASPLGARAALTQNNQHLR